MKVVCPCCDHEFDYESVSEAGIGYVACPDCGEPVTQLNAKGIITVFRATGDRKENPYHDELGRFTTKPPEVEIPLSQQNSTINSELKL